MASRPRSARMSAAARRMARSTCSLRGRPRLISPGIVGEVIELTLADLFDTVRIGTEWSCMRMRTQYAACEEPVAPSAMGTRQPGLGTKRPRVSERLVLPLIL